jgi:hypothetical protein
MDIIYGVAILAIIAVFGLFFVGMAVMIEGDEASGIVVMIVALLFIAIILIVILPFEIYAIGRWGLFGIYALVNGNFGFKDAGAASKGRFGAFFGTYALTYLIWVVISGVFQNLGSALIGFNTVILEDFKDLSQLTAFFTPVMIGKFAVFAFVLMAISALSYLAYICAGAFAYLKIKQAEVVANKETK